MSCVFLLDNVERQLDINLCVHIPFLTETCNYPSDLQSAVWEDSQKGSLTYTTNQMTGYTYSSYSSGSSIWNCFLIDGDYVVSK